MVLSPGISYNQHVSAYRVCRRVPHFLKFHGLESGPELGGPCMQALKQKQLVWVGDKGIFLSGDLLKVGSRFCQICVLHIHFPKP